MALRFVSFPPRIMKYFLFSFLSMLLLFDYYYFFCYPFQSYFLPPSPSPPLPLPPPRLPYVFWHWLLLLLFRFVRVSVSVLEWVAVGGKRGKEGGRKIRFRLGNDSFSEIQKSNQKCPASRRSRAWTGWLRSWWSADPVVTADTQDPAKRGNTGRAERSLTGSLASIGLAQVSLRLRWLKGP